MIWASKLEDFQGTDLNTEQLFSEATADELQRHLASDYRHGVLIYGEDGTVSALWSTSVYSDYFISPLPLGANPVRAVKAAVALTYVLKRSGRAVPV